ncbi:MAG: tRNA pseudouridine(38-40) synthase TruA [Acidobacteriota bacterium]
MLRNIRMILQYVGTKYHGWQIQENAFSIQEIIEEKLSLILNEKVRIIGAGRTDAGVHALAQVANFKTLNQLPIHKIFKGINSLLPEEIAVIDMGEAEMGFNARKDAKKKEYYYQIWNGEVIPPFLAPLAKHIPYKLDQERMSIAAAIFLGEHDFTSFCSSHSNIEDKVRTVYHSGIEVTGAMIKYRIIANGFLQHMVRNIVGTLIEIGKRKHSEREIEEILMARDRRKAGFAAPAKGLFLARVYY